MLAVSLPATVAASSPTSLESSPLPSLRISNISQIHFAYTRPLIHEKNGAIVYNLINYTCGLPAITNIFKDILINDHDLGWITVQ